MKPVRADVGLCGLCRLLTTLLTQDEIAKSLRRMMWFTAV